MHSGTEVRYAWKEGHGATAGDTHHAGIMDDSASKIFTIDHAFSEKSPSDDRLIGFDSLDPPAAPNRKQILSFGIFSLISIAMIATGIVVSAISEKKASTLAAEKARLEASTEGRSRTLRTWIDSLIMTGRRLSNSDLVRLYVDDVANVPAGHPLPRALLDQQPYFQTLITDFARQNDLLRAAVIDHDGRLLLGSSGPSLEIEKVLERVNQAPKDWKFIIPPIRNIVGKEHHLAMDLIVPMPKVQQVKAMSVELTTMLVLTARAEEILHPILSVSGERVNDEKIFLLQDGMRGVVALSALDADFNIQSTKAPLRSGDNAPFGRWSMNNQQSDYSLGTLVPDVNWTIVHSIRASAAFSPVQQFAVSTIATTIAVVLLASCCFTLFWWNRSKNHYKEIALVYQSMANRIDQQRQFLAAITSSISDWLFVANNNSQCLYANPALLKALSLREAEIIGREKLDVLPLQDSPPQNDCLDQFIEGEKISILDLKDRCLFVSSSKSDIRNHDGETVGTVTMMRDRTEILAYRQQRLKALTKTIAAFVQAIERRDPFLLGHTSRLRSYAIAVGRTLGMSEQDLAALSLAASLSQIGKIFIPDDILTKPERHTNEETEVMHRHIDHALSILDHIDLGLPVAEILRQMHERLDGSGYPRGVGGNEIKLPGRILGAVDVFCARTVPRSYRDRLSAGKTLFHLANNADRYDIRVIAALADVVRNEGALEAEQDQDASFVDSEVWKNRAAPR